MKPITRTQFRLLLTLSIAALIASTVVGMLTDRWLLPQDLRNYHATHRMERPQVRDVVVGVLGVPGWVGGVIAVIGLYRFRPSARWLALASWVYMLIWMPFSPGAVIASPLTGAFDQCSTLLVGVVLGLIYFSPAAEWFLSHGSPNQQGAANGEQPPGSEAVRTSVAAAPRGSP